jgi:Na+/H+ antiporter NhaD/arsenite permease-like protein
LSALSGVTGAKEHRGTAGQNAGALHVLAISVGAVFFGAATYIGNGPNFMVKAIADQQKIPMPISRFHLQIHPAVPAAGAYNRLVAFFPGLKNLSHL